MRSLKTFVGMVASLAANFALAQGMPATGDKPVDDLGSTRIVAPVDELAVDPIAQRIGSPLWIADREANLGNPDWAQAAGILDTLHDGERVLLEVEFDPMSLVLPIKDLIVESGGELRGFLSEDEAEAFVPAKSIGKFAAAKGIRTLRFPQQVQLALVSGGRQASNADWWQTVGGIGGDGIRIAVIDCFDTTVLATQRRAGEAPPADASEGTVAPASPQAIANGRSLLIRGASACQSDHGNIVLEALYDMAPRAQFLLINMARTGTAMDVATEVNLAIAQQVDIINFSAVHVLDGYNDGRGIGARTTPIFEQAHDRGIFVVTAAGNLAKAHWAGGFRAVGGNGIAPMDWNYNELADSPGVIDAGQGEQTVALLKPRSDLNNFCVQNGTPIVLELGISGYLQYRNSYQITLLRQAADNRWYVVARTGFARPRYNMALNYVADSRAATIDGKTNLGFHPSCTNRDSARYAVMVQRSQDGQPIIFNFQNFGARPLPEFLNFFVNQEFYLEFPVPQASLAGSAGSPKVFSVGAANCGSGATGCSDLRMEERSSRGPVLGAWGTKPVVLDAPTLHWVTGLGMVNGVKPDAASFSGTVTSVGGGSARPSGTSIAVPHTVGMAALLMQRYPFLRHNPVEIKQALSTIASQYDTMDLDLVRTGYRVGEYDYAYGRGLLRFRKEAKWGKRGFVENTVVGRVLSTVPDDDPLDGTQRDANRLAPFNDPYEADLHVRFLDARDRPVHFPVLMPGVSIINGPQTGLQYDGHQSTRTRFLFEYPPASAGVSAVEAGLGTWAGGYFHFPELRVTALPTTNVTYGVAQQYGIRFVPFRFDGTPAMGANLSGESLAGQFNVCTADAVSARRFPTLCPVR